jgi:CRISPR/Cas system-associated endoribonuclease Cas2
VSTRAAIVAYDIACSRRRRRVRGVLAEWRVGGQLSVHECRLTTVQAEELFTHIATEVDPARDRLLLAWVVPGRRVLARGRGRADASGRRLCRVG